MPLQTLIQQIITEIKQEHNATKLDQNYFEASEDIVCFNQSLETEILDYSLLVGEETQESIFKNFAKKVKQKADYVSSNDLENNKLLQYKKILKNLNKYKIQNCQTRDDKKQMCMYYADILKLMKYDSLYLQATSQKLIQKCGQIIVEIVASNILEKSIQILKILNYSSIVLENMHNIIEKIDTITTTKIQEMQQYAQQ